MKKLTWTSLFVSAAMLFTVGTGFASAEGNGTDHVDPEYTITIPYDYPVRPGTPEWAALEDNYKKIDITQIPENILHSMTTEALVDTVLDYPLFIDIYLSDTTTSNGYENAKEVFNGLTELANRPDAASILLDKYQKSDVITPNAYRSIPDVNKIFFDISDMEILLAQKDFYGQLNSKQLENLCDEAKEKYDTRSLYSDMYGFTRSMFYNVLLENQGGEIAGKGEIVPRRLPIISPPVNAPMAMVYTPKGSAVAVRIYGNYIAGYETTLKNEVASTYPRATWLSDPTGEYNCHSYTFYSQSTYSNKYSISNPMAYMTDGSYTLVTSPRAGDKLFYANSDSGKWHSGIVHGALQDSNNYAAVTVRSKWGYGGLYLHKGEHCPYIFTGTTAKFYRR